MTHIRRIANIIRIPRDWVPPSLQQLFLELADHYRNTSILAVNVRYTQDNADVFTLVSVRFIHDSQKMHRDLPDDLKQDTRELFEELFSRLNQYPAQHPTGLPPTPGLFRWDLRRRRLENIQSIRFLRRRPKITSDIPPCAGMNVPLSQSWASRLKVPGLLNAEGEGHSTKPTSTADD